MKPQFWNNRYQEHELAYGTVPNEFLVQSSSYIGTGNIVLSAGEGEGRNSVWMARKGLKVWAVDYSLVGLQKAQKQAKTLNPPITFICIDLLNWIWPPNYFDAMVVIFVHLSPLQRKYVHRQMVRSLKNKGHLIMQAFHKNQLAFDSGGPKSEEMLYTTDQLRADFRDCHIIEMEEKDIQLDEGPFHQGVASVINVIVKKKSESQKKRKKN